MKELKTTDHFNNKHRDAKKQSRGTLENVLSFGIIFSILSGQFFEYNANGKCYSGLPQILILLQCSK